MLFLNAGFLFLLLLGTVMVFPNFGEKPRVRDELNRRQSGGSVSVDGIHAFDAPSLSDLRGPCPGLNAAANHGYIPHSGYVSAVQVAQGINQLYGMAADLANFLAITAASVAGDGLSFSIGGPPPDNLLTGTGLLGKPQGLSNSHNRFEGDASPTRCDLYQCGEDYLVQIPLFQQLYSLADSTGSISIDSLSALANTRMEQSVSSNPYYFRGFVGVFIPTGTHALIYRMFANHTGPSPDGILSQSILQTIYSVTGSPGSFTYTPGHERIPENWYKRPATNEYTVPGFVADVVTFDSQHPQSASFGGNTGTVNSFVGVNITDLTQGTYNDETLLQGNNIGCFLFQLTASFMPDILRN